MIYEPLVNDPTLGHSLYYKSITPTLLLGRGKERVCFSSILCNRIMTL